MDESSYTSSLRAIRHVTVTPGVFSKGNPFFCRGWESMQAFFSWERECMILARSGSVESS